MEALAHIESEALQSEPVAPDVVSETIRDDRFVDLGCFRVAWVIPAVHGDVTALQTLHHQIQQRFAFNDRLIYLGNVIGHHVQSAACLDEVIRFRRTILSGFGVRPEDVVFLRGQQEEMWQKLLQIQFASNPVDVLRWMEGHGVSETILSYGQEIRVGLAAARDGTMSLTRWTTDLRRAMRNHAGHEDYFITLKRAAFSHPASTLFVHCGLNPARPLTEQKDSFWWNDRGFSLIHTPYEGFHHIVRGFTPDHKPDTPYTLTLGSTSPLTCTAFAQDGTVVDEIVAKA